MNAPVKPADPGAAYRAHQAEIDAAVARVLASGWYILGAEGKAFEAAFAAFLGTGHAIGCANGTDALVLALRGLGIGPGMTVATVSHTAVATVAAIEMVGATPLLLDIEPGLYTLDPGELASVLAAPPAGLPPIRAVVAVHLYGQAADLDAILPLCRAHSVALIEDCAQAHGATLHGRMLGGIGDVASFSFYPTKNLGALGDGGAVATSDAALATRIAALRQYGWHTHYISDEAGMNSRLDEIQAAILGVRLRHLAADTARRQAIASRYDAALRDLGRIAPVQRRDGAAHVFHQYVIEVAEREAVRAAMKESGVGTLIHYPMAVHQQPAYRDRVALGPRGCKVSEQAAARVLSLPIHPELTDAEVERVEKALARL
ncbi:MAG: DegT/DnrJ/EryC1/StrS family aminotransferase [Rhodospirillales bacterium]|nr:DegT/DnrJ/EryC1/StrS family aminotransferase [Rhodospirillales bacterium]